ncbi:hypothetical protein KL86APRO_30310 [uncultured Alphaproteobacteria bacterium]|uniref:Peptidoglycan binding-like domain-containing protein n=1 Tax=uncultured Alphaproteobacteria bacterium TaxID=91750 RepID=A0A212KMC3_9PROT|nr:hypothetical protein KL86APRO_30310 [uncultured Alphaproteobacteria bacterium]
MPLSDAFSGWNLPAFGVRAPVGGDAPLDPDDGARTRGALDHLGYRRKGTGDDPAALLDDLRDFQTDNGLDVDGLMNPGGPTEAALGVALARVGATDADTPVVPKGDTTERALRSLQETPRYPGDPGLRDHVTRQYEKAYPGPVRRDAAGAMLRPVAAVTPDAIAPYDPKGALRRRQAARHGTAGTRKLDLSDYTDGADAALPPEAESAKIRAYFAQAEEFRPQVEAWAREIHPSLETGKAEDFFAGMARIDALPEEKRRLLPFETAILHDVYRQTLGSGDTEAARQKAYEAGMNVGGLRYLDQAAWGAMKRAYYEGRAGLNVISGETVDATAYDGDMRADIPEGYRNSRWVKVTDGTVDAGLDLGTSLLPYGAGAIVGGVRGAGRGALQAAREGGDAAAQREAAVLRGAANMVPGVGRGRTAKIVGNTEESAWRRWWRFLSDRYTQAVADKGAEAAIGGTLATKPRTPK